MGIKWIIDTKSTTIDFFNAQLGIKLKEPEGYIYNDNTYDFHGEYEKLLVLDYSNLRENETPFIEELGIFSFDECYKRMVSEIGDDGDENDKNVLSNLKLYMTQMDTKETICELSILKEGHHIYIVYNPLSKQAIIFICLR